MSNQLENSSSPTTKTSDVVVIGAGISGLTTAYQLIKKGLSVQVIEANNRPGGKISSCNIDGFVREKGPNSGLNTTPLIGELVQLLNLEDEYLPCNSAADKRYIVRNGKLIAIPYSPYSMLTSKAFSLKGKLSILKEPFIPPAPEETEESVTQFVTRRLGQEFIDYAIEPFVAGIYAGNPDILSLTAAFPRLHILEQRYHSLIRGQILGARERKKCNETSKHIARSFSFKQGLQTLTDALANAIPNIWLNTEVKHISRNPNGMISLRALQHHQNHHYLAHSIILATPAHQSAQLVNHFAPEASQALYEIPYAPVIVHSCGRSLESTGHPLDGFGFLLPRIEKRNILGTLFSSSMFNHRAPEKHAVLTSFIGGQRQPELISCSDDEIQQIILQEHSALLNFTQPVLWQNIVRHQQAIPQYTMGHNQRIQQADIASHKMPGLFYCANWRGGISLADCIKSAHSIADKVAAFCKQLY